MMKKCVLGLAKNALRSGKGATLPALRSLYSRLIQSGLAKTLGKISSFAGESSFDV